MKRRRKNEAKRELDELMREHLESLSNEEFVQATHEDLRRQEERLNHIREVAADYLAAVKREAARNNLGGEIMSERPKVTLPGKVEKIIEPAEADESEKAQISVESADPLYRELRIDNKLEDAEGQEVNLKENDDVDVTIEADKDAAASPDTKIKDKIA